MSAEHRSMRPITTPDGETISLTAWCRRKHANISTAQTRYDRGIRDPMVLISRERLNSREKREREENKNWRIVLSPEKRAELRELATYSKGQWDQKYILCDFLPCPHRLADELMEALGL